MSQENVFYYDDERKMWLERGRAPPKEAPAVGAPPLRSEQSAASEIAGPPPVMAPSTHAKQQGGGVHTRYVSTFSTTSTPTAVAPQGFVPVAPNAGAVRASSRAILHAVCRRAVPFGALPERIQRESIVGVVRRTRTIRLARWILRLRSLGV